LISRYIKGEASIVLREFDSGIFHLCITSPPYPMIKKWDDCFKIIDFNKQHKQLDKVWKELYRCMIEGGIVCINIGDATRSVDGNFMCFPNYARIIVYCMELGFTPLIPIFWRKISNRPNAYLGSGMQPPNAYISQDCEYIMILRKGKLRKFPSKDRRRIDSSYTKEERDRWFQQVWKGIPGVKGGKDSSAFPERLVYRLVRMFSVIGDNIVDPFCGSGTTRRVAEKLNRNCIEIDIKDYR